MAASTPFNQGSDRISLVFKAIPTKVAVGCDANHQCMGVQKPTHTTNQPINHP